MEYRRLLKWQLNVCLLTIMLISVFSINIRADVTKDVEYNSYIQNEGWQGYVSNGSLSGTSGQSKSIEAVQINCGAEEEYSIVYDVFTSNNQWLESCENGQIAGKSGGGVSLKAIKIYLKDKNTGNIYTNENIWYRVHVKNKGWLDWTCNGQVSGILNENLSIEGIEIVIGDKPSIDYDKQTISYKSHVQSYGWQDYVTNGSTSGTYGQEKRMEAIQISLQENLPYEVEYSVHVQNYGWMNLCGNNQVAGTTGEGKRIEAIQITLKDKKTGNTTGNNIWYRVHVKNKGWMDWTKNGDIAGTVGQALQVEGIEIVVGDKPTVDYSKQDVRYKSHIQSIGWQNEVGSGTKSGTTGEGKRIEAIQLRIPSNMPYYIEYQVHLRNMGWINPCRDWQVAGTTGQSRQMEAIKIELKDKNTGNKTGDNIWYRVYVKEKGWMSWTKNGDIAGTTGQGLQIEAIEVTMGDKPKDTGTIITKDQLKRLGWSCANDEMVQACNYYLERFGITTAPRIRHFMSQCSYESACGKYTKELASGNNYEYRSDLGNVNPGDGPRYKGAGYIQLTGRSNYQSFSNYICDSRVMDGCDYVASKYPWASAAYWWYSNNMNSYVDSGATVKQVTLKVNGAYRGLEERTNYYNKAVEIFK